MLLCGNLILGQRTAIFCFLGLCVLSSNNIHRKGESCLKYKCTVRYSSHDSSEDGWWFGGSVSMSAHIFFTSRAILSKDSKMWMTMYINSAMTSVFMGRRDLLYLLIWCTIELISVLGIHSQLEIFSLNIQNLDLNWNEHKCWKLCTPRTMIRTMNILTWKRKKKRDRNAALVWIRYGQTKVT